MWQDLELYIPVHCNYLLTKRKLKVLYNNEKSLSQVTYIQNVACTKMYMYY
jgi:hypothetical protein